MAKAAVVWVYSFRGVCALPEKWLWLLTKLTRRIWFRATLLSLLAVATALVAIIVAPYIPAGLSAKIGADAVDNILGIIASSMLTVTTFSLSTMVSAYSAATSNVTPRATRLVMEDSTTQNVLATFVGSFLFSLVGIVALSTGAYGDQGRLVLFIVTIGVIILIVVTLLRWIDHLSRLGRVTETTQRVEEATIKALEAWQRVPHLGGIRLTGNKLVGHNFPIYSNEIGYVQHVDASALSSLAEDADVEFSLLAIPGKLVAPNTPVAWSNTELNENQIDRFLSSLTIDDTRSFDQDPRFGASVLSEVASRSLSTAINDPGTTIDVVSRSMRVVAAWAAQPHEDAPVYPRLHVRPIELDDLFDDLFTIVARDGAGLVEVGLRLQKTLALIAEFDGEGFRENAQRCSKEAITRAEAVLTAPQDLERLRRAANWHL